MKLFLDTSVLVAAFIEEHEHHTRAQPIVNSVHEGTDEGFVSAHSLLEVYAVLTRLPRSPRLMPLQAAALVQENILRHFSIVAFTGREYSGLVVELGRSGVLGGQSYDALHLECARKSGVERIYTFNVKHFKELAPNLASKIAAP